MGNVATVAKPAPSASGTVTTTFSYNSNPPIDPVGPFGLFGSFTDEETRGGGASTGLILKDGNYYDPFTCRKVARKGGFNPGLDEAEHIALFAGVGAAEGVYNFLAPSGVGAAKLTTIVPNAVSGGRIWGWLDQYSNPCKPGPSNVERGFAGYTELSAETIAIADMGVGIAGVAREATVGAAFAGGRAGSSAVEEVRAALERPSSRVLGRRMAEAGFERPAGSAAHHIVAGADPRAALARSILQREGVGINEASNGVYVEPRLHYSTFTRAYHEDVAVRLARMEPGSGRQVLKEIADDILAGRYRRN